MLRFPIALLKVIDLESMHSYVSERCEVVNERIEKRKEEENKKR